MTQSVDIEKAKKLVVEEVDRHSEDLKAISQYLYAHPELSWKEYLAADYLAGYLQGAGFAVERGIHGLETAFRAAFSSDRPGLTVAFLAEYDALPDVGHGCGHNLIAASAVGAGLAAKAVLESGMAGKVIVLGTPAEEFGNQPQGKVKLLERGAFEGVDIALMCHPYTRSASYNTCLAFVSLEIVFHGQTAHAAADPWNGRNALDAVILTFNHVSALRQHVRPEIRMHGIISEGGIVPNIIPERAAARFMLRAPQFQQVQEVLARFRNLVEGAALATGTTAEITILGSAANVHPYPTLQAMTKGNFDALGEPFDSPVNSSGSTDFGDVSQHLPADSFYINLRAGPITWHSRQVADASVTPQALEGMLAAAKVLAMDAVDLWSEPEIIERARSEMPTMPASRL